MDKRKDNGGAREGAGRKPKTDEQALVEKLSPLEESAFKSLKKAVASGDNWAIKLFFEYMYGKPKQQLEQTNVNYNSEITKEEAKAILEGIKETYG